MSSPVQTLSFIIGMQLNFMKKLTEIPAVLAVDASEMQYRGRQIILQRQAREKMQ